MIRIRSAASSFFRLNSKLLDFPALLLSIVILWGALGYLQSASGDVGTTGQSIDLTNDTIVSFDDRDLSNVDWASDAPSVLWIDFDNEAVNAARRAHSIEAKDPRVSLKQEVALVLDWVRENANPKVVYLDMTPTDAGPDAETAQLKRSLSQWALDSNAPPLAVFAGQACIEEGARSNREILPASEFPSILFPSGTAMGQTPKIIWSCPNFAGLQTAFWSCTYAETGEAFPAHAALPSPGWISIAASEAGGEFANWIQSGLEEASKSCRDARNSSSAEIGAPGIQVPRYSRTRFTFDPLDLSRHTSDGNPLVEKISATPIILGRTAESGLLDDRIVVIGSSDTSRGFADEVQTSVGFVPGSLIVSTQMREAWVQGFPKLHNWTDGAIRSTIACVICWLVIFVARIFRHKARQNPDERPFVIIATDSGTLTILFLALYSLFVIFSATRITQDDVLLSAVSVIAFQLQFAVRSITEEFDA